MTRFRSVLITGASSGIGEALALEFADAGTYLFLSGRNHERLEQVAAACRAKGAVVEAQVMDIRHQSFTADWVRNADETMPLDLVVANAGIAAGQCESEDFEKQSREIIDTNLIGVLNTVFPALGVMSLRNCGQIGIMSSLAGFYGLSSTPAYSSSKAATRSLGEALRARYWHTGIGLSVICPGHVHSRMSADNRFPMLFVMNPDKAAKIIRRGLEKNTARIAFPLQLVGAVWLLSTLPAGLANWLTKNLPRKE